MEGPQEAKGKRGCPSEHSEGSALGRGERSEGEEEKQGRGRWPLGGEKGMP